MNILVTGGTGFIGSHLVHRLLDKKYKVFLLKRKFSDTWRIKNIIDSLVVYNLDKNYNFEKIFADNKIDVVIHLAGYYVKYEKTHKEIKEMDQVNINFPKKLLNCAIRTKTKGFINTGTFFEYKQTKKPIDEKKPKKPFNYYAETKIVFEQILKKEALKKRIKGVTLKPFSPYGEKDNPKVILLMLGSFLENKPLLLTDGKQKLSFTYIDDIVEAYIKTINFIMSSNYRKYEDFNIGYPKVYSLKQIAKIWQKITDKKGNLHFNKLEIPKNEVKHALCNSKKAEMLLSWYPKTDIIKGLTKTYQYYYCCKND